jgi:hypothetical protein
MPASTYQRTDPRSAAARTPAEPPFDVEAARRALMRKLEMFAADWRRCPRRVCRRRRACTPRDIHCFAPRPPERPMTPDQEARMMAALKRELERRLGSIRQGAEARNESPSPGRPEAGPGRRA